MSGELFSIGHSTHPFEELVALLTRHGIGALADIRRFPGSKKFPQFNQGSLAAALPAVGIEYRWLESLGGRRHKSPGGSSKNLGLRNESFRNYADYMLTAEFHNGLQHLLTLAAEKPTAMMCSESVFWRCHRRLVSDYLFVNGTTVQHIMPTGELKPHTLTEGAQVIDGELLYLPPETNPTQRLFE